MAERRPWSQQQISPCKPTEIPPQQSNTSSLSTTRSARYGLPGRATSGRRGASFAIAASPAPEEASLRRWVNGSWPPTASPRSEGLRRALKLSKTYRIPGSGHAAVGVPCLRACRAAARCSGSSLRLAGSAAAYCSSSARSQRVLRGPNDRAFGNPGSLQRSRKRRREMPSNSAERRASSKIGAVMAVCWSRLADRRTHADVVRRSAGWLSP